jgi:segregation and condensation protein B
VSPDDVIEATDVAAEAAELDPDSVTDSAVLEEPSADVLDVPLRQALEALLLVVDEPVDTAVLAAAVGRPLTEVGDELVRIVADLENAGTGWRLRSIGGGWRLYTAPAAAPVVERFLREGQQARLTQAALETLAVVAYRQPVSRARVSAVRGVNVDSVMRTLQTRGLVEETGHDPHTGATMYGTTSYFLERLGLTSLEDLPPVADYLPNVDALDELLEEMTAGE